MKVRVYYEEPGFAKFVPGSLRLERQEGQTELVLLQRAIWGKRTVSVEGVADEKAGSTDRIALTMEQLKNLNAGLQGGNFVTEMYGEPTQKAED